MSIIYLWELLHRPIQNLQTQIMSYPGTKRLELNVVQFLFYVDKTNTSVEMTWPRTFGSTSIQYCILYNLFHCFLLQC